MNSWSKLLVASAAAAITLILVRKHILTNWRKASEVKHGVSQWTRPLGDAHETFLYKAGKHSLWNIATVQTFASREPVTTVMIQDALLVLARSHPILRVGIKELSGKPVYEEIFDFQVPLTESNGADWMPLFEKFLKEPHNEAGPLWKVAIAGNSCIASETDDVFPHECTLVFGAHHAMMDGASFMILLQELLVQIEKYLTGEHPSDAITPDVTNQSEDLPLELLIPPFMKTPWQAVKIWTITSLLKIPFGIWLYKKTRPVYPENVWLKKFGIEVERDSTATTKTTILPHQFSQEESQSILSVCSDHNVSVLSTLAVAVSVAAANILQEDKITTPQGITSSIPFSMRRHIPKHFSQKMMGSYYDTFSDVIIIKPNWQDTFWDVVQEYHRTIQRYVRQGYASESSTVPKDRVALAFEGTELSFFRSFTPRSRGSVFSMSNMGQCDFVDAGLRNVKLKAGFSAASEHVAGPVFSNTLCTIGGRLCWSLVYYPNIMTKHTAENIWQNIMDVLKQQKII